MAGLLREKVLETVPLTLGDPRPGRGSKPLLHSCISWQHRAWTHESGLWAAGLGRGEQEPDRESALPEGFQLVWGLGQVRATVVLNPSCR